jgi:hypothetical protein
MALMNRVLMLGGLAMAAAAAGQDCSVRQGEGWVVLTSPAFSFRLSTTDGLQAEWVENRLSGGRIALDGPELEADIGLPDGPVETVRFRVVQVAPGGSAATGGCVFRLQAEKPALTATVTYRWDATEPVLRKSVGITSGGPGEINRLLQVRLGAYDRTPVGPVPLVPGLCAAGRAGGRLRRGGASRHATL